MRVEATVTFSVGISVASPLRGVAFAATENTRSKRGRWTLGLLTRTKRTRPRRVAPTDIAVWASDREVMQNTRHHLQNYCANLEGSVDYAQSPQHTTRGPRSAATMASASGMVAGARDPSVTRACGHGRGTTRWCVTTPRIPHAKSKARRLGLFVARDVHLAAYGRDDGDAADDSSEAVPSDTRVDDPIPEITYPFEDPEGNRSTDTLLPGGTHLSAISGGGGDGNQTMQSADPVYGRGMGVVVTSSPPKKMTPFHDTVLNLGLVSTAVLIALGIRKAKKFFDGVPDLPEEERLRRMKSFCDAQIKRVESELPEGDEQRANELKRLTEVKVDIDKKLKKFASLEEKRREWNKRLRRLDERGEPVRKTQSRSDNAEGNDDSNDDSARPGVPSGRDEYGFDTDGFGASIGRVGGGGGGVSGDAESSAYTSERNTEASNRQTVEFELDPKTPLPGASARWVKATDYLQSAVEKTAKGFNDAEGFSPDAPPTPLTAPKATPGQKAGSGLGAGRDKNEKVSERESTVPETSSSAQSLDNCPPTEVTPKTQPETPIPQPKPTPPKNKTPSKPKITHPDEVLADRGVSGPAMTPEKEAAIAREINQLEQMYGDDRSITAEELDVMCMKVIEKYGLADGKFSDDELYDPNTDRGSSRGGGPEKDSSQTPRHVSEDDPFYWRKLKVVFPIFEANPESKTTQIMTMNMTHPGLPAYLPGATPAAPKRKPVAKQHAVAFETRNDAERFVWFMRSTRGQNEGICTTQAMPPDEVELIATAEGLGVTVVGEDRVNLDASRRDLDVLSDIREIGGELSLWEFAQWTKHELEEQRKPPPPTISY